jgi:WD40 repeat protein
VRVVDETGNGLARITLSFPNWLDGHVSPSTTDLPVSTFTVVESVQIRTTLRGHVDPVWALVCSPDGKVIASSTIQGAVKLWDAESAKPLGTLADHPGMVYSMAFAPDGKTLAVGVYKQERARVSGEIRLWDIATKELRQTLKREPSCGVGRIAFSPDGKTLAAEEESKVGLRGRSSVEVALWDLASRKVRAALNTSATGLIFSPDGRSVITVGQGLRVWNPEAGSESASLAGSYTCLACSPDGRLAAAGDYTGKITLWDLAKSEAAGTIQLEENPRIYSLAFSPDGKMLAAGTGDPDPKFVKPARIALVDLSTLEERQTLRGHRGAVQSVVFSPNGHVLFSGSQDMTVKVWDLQRRTENTTGQ